MTNIFESIKSKFKGSGELSKTDMNYYLTHGKLPPKTYAKGALNNSSYNASQIPTPYSGGQELSPTEKEPIQTKTLAPGGGLGGTMKQLPEEGKPSEMVAFQTIMREVATGAYEDRQKGEGKITKGQFDPKRVSGNTFKDIIQSVESSRGQDISKTYAAGVNLGIKDLELKEKKRQFDIEQDNKKFEIINDKQKLGIDSVYIPGGTLADKNNNPGNLRFVGQAGSIQGEGGFAKFATPEAGYQALINQVRLDQSRGMTLAQFVSKYAPPTENNTSQYVEQMSQWLGVSADAPLASLNYNDVAQAIAKKESGTEFISGDGGGALDITDNQRINLETKLGNNFERYAKESRDAVRQISTINASMKKAEEDYNKGDSINAVSQGVLVSFQKMLDPTSVVRESEYARSGDGQSLFQRIEGTYLKLKQGGAGVTLAGLKEFVKTANIFLDNYKQSQLNFAKRVEIQADNYGLNLENILTPDVIAILGESGGNDSNSVSLKDPKTGEIRVFTGLSEAEIKEATNNGYILIN